MISSLVDLKETLNVVARHIPVVKRNAIVKRVEVLIVSMAEGNHYANNLQEGISIIKIMIDHVENKTLLHRELSDLNLFLVKWEEKQQDLFKQSKRLQNAYSGQAVRGTIFSKYF